ncbi:TRAP-type C4-dicarboxylate transport system, periplasmic component [Hoeflea sp. IMCC20628]|uniref:TRAP transporter substrate-binding protein DctP n=1 Tax=Hoeflea sp. IMCC20628 TaxID=1620421 RepID=UPI00063BEC8F|nr:TRAP transporter substrate-binding protein DctP [Hoeflea sp. IMCC20628]AKH98921.1 TRAP-type C4-dicarboxylate transport system, periplasmic component [Hoeflea sp. IMCC20628]
MRSLVSGITIALMLQSAAWATDEPLAEMQKNMAYAMEWSDGKLDNYGAPEVTYDGDPVTLNFSSHLPEQSAQARFLKKSFDVLNKMSKGKLSVEARWSGTVHSVSEGFEANRSGITDMSSCFTFLNTKNFPLTEALTLPGLFPNAGVLSIVAEELTDEYFREEFERQGVYLQGITGSVRFNLFSNVPITTLEELAGKKVRSGTGVNQDVFTALGAVPVNMSSADFFSALQRGLLDAVFTSDTAAKSFRINEASTHHTDTPINHTPLEFCMSPRRIDALPDNLREILYVWARQRSQAESQLSFTLASAEAREEFIEQGIEYHTIAPEEYKRWEAIFADVIEAYIVDGEAKGLPTRKLVADIRERAQKYSAMSYKELLETTINNPADGVSPRTN